MGSSNENQYESPVMGKKIQSTKLHLPQPRPQYIKL